MKTNLNNDFNFDECKLETETKATVLLCAVTAIGISMLGLLLTIILNLLTLSNI